MDDDVEAFARARKRKLWTRLLVLGALFLSPCGYLGWRFYSAISAEESRGEARRKARVLSEAERAALRSELAAARRRLVEARGAWTRGVTPETLAAVAPGDGPCGARVIGPTAQAAATYTRYGSTDPNYHGNVFFRRHAVGAPIPPLDIDAQIEQLGKIDAELEADTADREDLTRLRGLDDTSLFVVVTQDTAPVVLGGGAAERYRPGRLVGTAYVYSFTQQRITCVGPVDATNGESIEIGYQYKADSFVDKEDRSMEAARITLRRDLEAHVLQELAHSLRAAAP
jgi:hypothetical protein